MSSGRVEGWEGVGCVEDGDGGVVAAKQDIPEQVDGIAILAFGGREQRVAFGVADALGRTVAERVERYREDVSQYLKRGVDPTRQEQFRDVVAVGSATFIARVKQLAGEGERETERRSRLRKRVSFEDVVRAVEQARGLERAEWLTKHGDVGKWVVLRLARRYTGMTLSELGAELDNRDYAAVSTGLRRFEAGARKRRAVAALQTRATQML